MCWYRLWFGLPYLHSCSMLRRDVSISLLRVYVLAVPGFNSRSEPEFLSSPKVPFPYLLVSGGRGGVWGVKRPKRKAELSSPSSAYRIGMSTPVSHTILFSYKEPYWTEFEVWIPKPYIVPLWVMTPWSLVVMCQHIGRIYCIHFQGRM